MFQKFVQLPKSRWTATKDQIVNIPIFDKDIINTVESFPRTPEEAGIIPVKLKRKLEYKNNHIEQYISTKKIFEALNTLKSLGNKYYQFVSDMDNYKKKCQNMDPKGFDFIFREVEDEVLTEDKNEETEVFMFQDVEDEVLTENKNEETEVLSDSDKEEEECILKDSARKWQFQYNSSTCFSNDFPELDVDEKTNNDNTDESKTVHSVAPEEGKKPTNILNEED